MRRTYKAALCLGICGAAALCFYFFISLKPDEHTEEDILTQTVIAHDKIPVTILVKYAFSINAFEKEAERIFPKLDIIQVGNYTSDRGIVESAAAWLMTTLRI